MRIKSRHYCFLQSDTDFWCPRGITLGVNFIAKMNTKNYNDFNSQLWMFNGSKKKSPNTSQVDRHKWTHAKSTVLLKTVVKQHNRLLLGYLFCLEKDRAMRFCLWT